MTRSLAAVVLLSLGASGPALAQTQPAPTAPATPWTLSIRDLTRVETWRFFQPQPGGGDPDYAFLANRLQLELRGVWPKAEVTVTAQHVGFLGLPERAAGPGPLGTGALYFDQGGRRTNPQQLYLRYAHVRFRNLLPGVDVQAGRMAYTSGGEAPSGVAKVETVKRQRLDARLVGEFEWSIYQRGYDGIRVDVSRPSFRLTGFAFMPTQGGFARRANPSMTEVTVAGATWSSIPAGSLSRTQLQGFVYHYADDRLVTQRPDNTGRAATRADVAVTTFGGTLVGAYPAGAGEADLLLWTAIQRGNWYGDDHRGFSIAAEGGVQWTSVRWRPWLRGGLLHASGDTDASDRTHGTFFAMVPTMRRYSQTTAYSTMNLNDMFVYAIARPTPSLGLRLDVHRLWLASAADLWYAGSGATLNSGSAFGFAGRPSRGARSLGTTVEASADYAVNSRWSFNVFVARMAGGPVVTRTFQGGRLWFVYVENVVRLDWRR